MRRLATSFKKTYRFSDCGILNLAVPHHCLAAHNRANRPADHVAAIVRRPTSAAFDPIVADGGALLEIDNCEVGIVAGGDASLTDDAKQPLRAVTGQIDKAL